MIRLELAALCESASVDIATNQVSLFKIIEGMNYPAQFPAVIPKLTLVMFWDKVGASVSRTERAVIRISLDPPSSATESFGQSNVNVEIPSGKRRARLIYELAGIPIAAPGRVSVVIKKRQGSNWEDVGSVAFDVTNNPSPSSTGSIPL